MHLTHNIVRRKGEIEMRVRAGRRMEVVRKGTMRTRLWGKKVELKVWEVLAVKIDIFMLDKI